MAVSEEDDCFNSEEFLLFLRECIEEASINLYKKEQLQKGA